ncbi:unnamed protein product [Cuscuta epithymum]|uniref:Uncharacterized protein n=1 Tax=Cuscuta epithymum TaxID=186058 RepID=A0AAV0DVP8_9ASTE|nr:unnamed protein product [Cuscuta epithymum]
MSFVSSPSLCRLGEISRISIVSFSVFLANSMRRFTGFFVKQRVTTLFRRLLRRRRSPSAYQRLDPPSTEPAKLIPSLSRFTRHLTSKARAICSKAHFPVPGSGWRAKDLSGWRRVPKGHLAVYVGRRDEDFKRVLVPAIYFNHPLFGELLRDAEEEFGFCHPGRIAIPCRISEFERVRTRIMEGTESSRRMVFRRHDDVVER